jgi:hypothetical protein
MRLRELIVRCRCFTLAILSLLGNAKGCNRDHEKTTMRRVNATINAVCAAERRSSKSVMRQSLWIMWQRLLCDINPKANASYQTQKMRSARQTIKAVLPKQTVAGSSPVSRSPAKVQVFTGNFGHDRVRTSCVKVHQLLIRKRLLSSDFRRQTPTMKASPQSAGGHN